MSILVEGGTPNYTTGKSLSHYLDHGYVRSHEAPFQTWCLVCLGTLISLWTCRPSTLYQLCTYNLLCIRILYKSIEHHHVCP